MSTPASFSGFPAGALSFYAELEDRNSRDWWLAHKDVYERDVREPMLALLDGLEEEFGEAKLFRPNRDVRFSADKSPYKTHQGALVGSGTVLGYYVQVSADGLRAGGGFRAASPAQTARFRAAVDAPSSGLSSSPSWPPCAASVSSARRAGQDDTEGVCRRPPAHRDAASQGAHGHARLRRAGLARHEAGA